MIYDLVDFHCHLDLYPDFEKLITESEKARIYTLAVTTTPRAWQRNYELTRDLKFVRPALGLHPQLVGKNTERELNLWEKLLPQARYIGEVGLDAGPDYYRTLNEQKRVFERILILCAEAGGKVISVHAIRSVSTVLDMVEKLLPVSRGRVVLHWFTGSPAQARRAIELGCYFSVNVPMLVSARHHILFKSIPLDRLLTETDGPFTTLDGRSSRPADAIKVLDLLSKQYHVPIDEISAQVTRNLRVVLNI